MMRGRSLGLSVLITIIGIFVAYGTGLPLAAGFALGVICTVVIACRNGMSARQIGSAMWEGAFQTREVMLILCFVGLLIPVWTASGTMPLMIETAVRWLDPGAFLLFCFGASALVSMLLGTATGTMSSLGIPLIGAAAVLDIPVAMCAGALVSGAFVGDRASPFSSASRLVASSTGLPFKEHGKALRPTTFAALAVSVLFYAMLDAAFAKQGAGRIELTYGDWYDWSFLLWLPPVVLLAAILLRLPLWLGFTVSIASGIAAGSLLQGIGWSAWLDAMIGGYRHPQFPELDTKGLKHMLDLVLLIGLAGAMIGILEKAGSIEPVIRRWIGPSSSMLRATGKLLGFSVVLGMISCMQTLPIMVAGKTVRPVWIERFAPQELSRVVADTALVAAGLIPWNLLALLCAAILNVPVVEFAPFAVFLWSLPVLTLLVSLYRDRRHRSLPASKREVAS